MTVPPRKLAVLAIIALLSASLRVTASLGQSESSRDAGVRARILQIFSEELDLDKRQAKLDAIGLPLVDALIALAGGGVRFYDCEQALVRIGRPVVPRLIRGVDSGDPVEAVLSLRALAAIDDDRKFTTLWKSIQSSDEELALTALEASARQQWPDGFWTPARLERIVKMTRSESEYKASDAVKLLLAIGDLFAIDELRAVLSDPEGPTCERYSEGDLRRELSSFPHAEVSRLFDLADLGHCWGSPGMIAGETFTEPRPLWIDLDPAPKDLLQALRGRAFGPPQGTATVIGSLMERVAQDRAPELLVELGKRVDQGLRKAIAPSAELETLASLSPAKAGSGLLETNDRFPALDETGILNLLREPATIPVLLRRLRAQATPEQWFPTAQSLGRFMSQMSVAKARDYLDREHISEVQIEAVLQARESLPPKAQRIAPRFPIALPTDRLSRIAESGMVEDKADAWRLYTDRLATSSALLSALDRNPEALETLSASQPSAPSEAADLVWVLTRVPSQASTARLRDLLAEEGPAVPMIARELGHRGDRDAVPALLALLGSARDLDCSAAARALGAMRVQEALPLLRRELDRRQDPFVERDLVEAIVRVEGDAAVLQLIAKNLSPASRRYLYFPLARVEPAGVGIVQAVFRNSVPDKTDSWPAGRALVASDRLGATLGFIDVLLERRDLIGDRGYSITQQLVPRLTELHDAPELVEAFADLVADPIYEAWASQGLARQPGEFADTVIRAALLRGASPSRFTKYLSQRPIAGLGPQLKATYLRGGRKPWQLDALIASGVSEGMEVVRELLETETPARVFVAVIESLYKTPHQEGWGLLPELYQRLGDRDLFLALSRIPPRPPQPALTDYLVSLLDREPVEVKELTWGGHVVDVAAEAASALDRLDAATAVDEILKCWDHESVRDASVELVGRHATPAAINFLFELIRKRDYSAWRRVEVAIAEAARKYPLSITDYVNDPDTEIRRKLAVVSGEFQDPVTDRLLLRLAFDTDPFVRSQAVASMDRGPADRFSKAVLEALSDQNERVRREAVRTAGVLEIKEAVAALAEILAQADDPLAREAAHSLARLGGRQAVAALVRASTGPSPNLDAVRGLGRMGEEEAVPTLVRIVAGGNLEARHVALQALGRIGTREAVKAIFAAHLESQSYVDRYLQEKASAIAANAGQPAAPFDAQAGRSMVRKSPDLAIASIDPGRFRTESSLTETVSAGATFSYHQENTRSWVLWTEYQRRQDGGERWLLRWSHSDDGELDWSPAETILTSEAPLSHYQLVELDNGERLVMVARGRQIFAVPWDGSQVGQDSLIPVGPSGSKTVEFNLLRRRDGTYLLFAAVGTSVPNRLGDKSQLVALSSRDLSNWSAPIPIAPIPDRLGYFSVTAIPAVEAPDGSVLVGVGTQVYRSRDLAKWTSVWDGRDKVVGWQSGVASLALGPDGRIHLGYRSKAFGYNDLYITSTSDPTNWSTPVFTTVHNSIGTAVSEDLGPIYLRPGHGQEMATVHYSEVFGKDGSGRKVGGVIRSELDLEALSLDSDGDGLSDAIEQRLLTDPNKVDTDGDGIDDGEDRNPLASPGPPEDRNRIRQVALERLNHWNEQRHDSDGRAPLMIVVTDGGGRQEFSGYSGVILNLSGQERRDYWKKFGRFGISTQEVVINSLAEGGSAASVHTFTGHEAFSMTVRRLGRDWVVTKVEATFRVY